MGDIKFKNGDLAKCVRFENGKFDLCHNAGIDIGSLLVVSNVNNNGGLKFHGRHFYHNPGNFKLVYRYEPTQEDIENAKVDFTDKVSANYDYINPSHYQKFSVEVIDMMVNIWGKEKVATYCEIAAFKYKLRIGEKPGQPVEQDLKKAEWYLNKAKELRS